MMFWGKAKQKDEKASQKLAAIREAIWEHLIRYVHPLFCGSDPVSIINEASIEILAMREALEQIRLSVPLEQSSSWTTLDKDSWSKVAARVEDVVTERDQLALQVEELRDRLIEPAIERASDTFPIGSEWRYRGGNVWVKSVHRVEEDVFVTFACGLCSNIDDITMEAEEAQHCMERAR